MFAMIENRAGRSARRRAREIRLEHWTKSARNGGYAALGAGGVALASTSHGTGSLAASLVAGVGTAVWLARRPTEASRWLQGAEAEQRTAHALKPLKALGWWVGHDRSIPKSKANLDHVLADPTGKFMVYVDTKAWHAKNAVIRLSDDLRLMYGPWDKTRDVRTVEWEAGRLHEELGVPVVPVITIDGGEVQGQRPGFIQMGGTYVISSKLLVTALSAMQSAGRPDPRAVRRLADRVNATFPAA